MEKEQIHILLRSLSLTPSETETTTIPDADIPEEFDTTKRSAIGKFIAKKDIIVKGMKTAMKNAWHCEDFRVMRHCKNIYQFVFRSQEELIQILAGGPWVFDNHLLVMKEWCSDWESKEDLFAELYFWAHIVGFPDHLYNDQIGRRIATTLDQCTTMQIREDLDTGLRFFRAKIRVRPADAIRRFIRMRVGSNETEEVGLLQYERLPFICFRCGHFDHTLAQCDPTKTEATAEEIKKMPYKLPLKVDNNRRSSLIAYVKIAPPSETLAIERTLTGNTVPEQPAASDTTVHKTTSKIAGEGLILQNLTDVQIHMAPQTLINNVSDMAYSDDVMLDVENLDTNATGTQTITHEIQDTDALLTLAGPSKNRGFKRLTTERQVLGDITNSQPSQGKRKAENKEEDAKKQKRGKTVLALLSPAEVAEEQPRQTQ